MSSARVTHYLRRAEKLRIAMLTAHDPATQSRLRNLVHKYRDLALRAEKKIDSPPLQTAEEVTAPTTGKHLLSES